MVAGTVGGAAGDDPTRHVRAAVQRRRVFLAPAARTCGWFAIVITGGFASAFAYFIQTWAQAHISATRTAVVLATEPAWALVAAVVLAGQRFGPLEAAGAALVLVGDRGL